MVSRMDRDVGRLMEQLKDMGVDEHTLVLFTSDNGATYDIGGAHSEFFRSNGDLRGAKGSIYEGGLRVPLIARWPGTINPGQVSDGVGAFWDLMPTLLDVADSKTYQATPDLDGASLLPVLRGADPDPNRTLYWEFPSYGHQQALRQGDWMLVRRQLAKKGETTTELFNLADDISQKNDLAAEYPERVQAMLDRMAAEHIPSEKFPLHGVDIPAE